MKLKTLVLCTIIGVTLISGSVSAGNKHYHGKHHHGGHHHNTHTHYVQPKHLVEADNWHQHPANRFTKDTLHNHPNGLNHHVHTYGAGVVKKPHTHHGFTYAICPYPGH